MNACRAPNNQSPYTVNITPNNVTQPKSAKLLGEEPSPLMVLTHAVRKYSLTLVLVTLPVFVGVTFYTLGQTKIYRASMTIRIGENLTYHYVFYKLYIFYVCIVESVTCAGPNWLL